MLSPKMCRACKKNMAITGYPICEECYYQVHCEECTTCGRGKHLKKGTNLHVAKMKKCKACHTTRYCSRECQRIDWPFHKLFCAELPKMIKERGIPS